MTVPQGTAVKNWYDDEHRHTIKVGFDTGGVPTDGELWGVYPGVQMHTRDGNKFETCVDVDVPLNVEWRDASDVRGTVDRLRATVSLLNAEKEAGADASVAVQERTSPGFSAQIPAPTVQKGIWVSELKTWFSPPAKDWATRVTDARMSVGFLDPDDLRLEVPPHDQIEVQADLASGWAAAGVEGNRFYGPVLLQALFHHDVENELAQDRGIQDTFDAWAGNRGLWQRMAESTDTIIDWTLPVFAPGTPVVDLAPDRRQLARCVRPGVRVRRLRQRLARTRRPDADQRRSRRRRRARRAHRWQRGRPPARTASGTRARAPGWRQATPTWDTRREPRGTPTPSRAPTTSSSSATHGPRAKLRGQQPGPLPGRRAVGHRHRRPGVTADPRGYGRGMTWSYCGWALPGGHRHQHGREHPRAGCALGSRLGSYVAMTSFLGVGMRGSVGTGAGTGAPVLGQVFSACEVLPPAARVELASRLPAAGGRPPALFPAELAAASLALSAGRRAGLRQVVESALDVAALARLDGVRLRDLVPAIAGRDGEVDPGPDRTRLRKLLERHGVTTWATLGELTVGEIMAWPGVGPTAGAALVGVAFDAGLSFLGDEAAEGAFDGSPDVQPAPGLPAAGTSEPAVDDVRLLLQHDGRAGGGRLRAVLERSAAAGAPEPVRAAAHRLLSLPPPVLPTVAWLDRVLAAAGDHRDRAVFVHGALRLAGRPSRSAIAEALGVGVERVRQLVARAVERVAVASAGPPSEVARVRNELTDGLGEAAPLGAVDGLLADAGLPALPDTRSLLLLWLVGPYTVVPGLPGWVATDPAGLLAVTRRVLAEDGGVVPAEVARKELDMAGVPEQHVDGWLAEHPVVEIDGLLVLTTGSPADVAERALFAAGRALSAGELAVTAWPDADAAPDLHDLERVLHRDGRFVRVSATGFELAEWGSEPYRDVPAGVTPVGDEADRCWLEVTVDGAVLAGAEAPVPVPLATALGLREGVRRTFTTRFGPVALAYDGGRAVRGTLRPIALAAGAGPGDVVALGFCSGDGSAVVRRILPTPLDQTA